jgi:hypothetical protein
MIRRAVAVTALAGLGFGLAGCAGYRVERNGKDAGKAICDMKSASNPDQLQRAYNRYTRNADKATKITGRRVGEDVQDIDNNLNDLKTHVTNKQKSLAQQDVAVIQRNTEQVAKNSTGLTKRYYEGMDEGLSDCTG